MPKKQKIPKVTYFPYQKAKKPVGAAKLQRKIDKTARTISKTATKSFKTTKKIIKKTGSYLKKRHERAKANALRKQQIYYKRK